MVRFACLVYCFMAFMIVALVINPSGARPYLTNIGENVIWTAVTDQNEIYKDNKTGQEWTTFKITIPAGEHNCSIKNDVIENTSFYWKSDQPIGEKRIFRKINFYKDSEKMRLEQYSVGKWTFQNFSDYTVKNNLNFDFDFKATILIAFVPQPVSKLPITIQNKPPNKPNCNISSDVTLLVNESLCIRATATDPDKDSIDLIWVWGDGGPDNQSQGITSGGNFTECHLWKEAGNYSIVITARDSKGYNNSSTININVLPPERPINASAKVQPPTKPELNVSSYGVLWLGYNLFIRASSRDPNNDSINYSWDWGDESHDNLSPFVPSGNDDNQSHLYRDPGNYTITITASTQKGGNNSSTINLTVLRPKPPETPLGECIGYVNSSSKYSTSLDTSLLTKDALFLFDWRFNDASISTTGADIMYKWPNNGSKKVKARALDIQGNPSNWSEEINVDVYEPKYVECNQDLQNVIDNATDYEEIITNCSEHNLSKTLIINEKGHISVRSNLPNTTILKNSPSMEQLIYITDSNCINISNLTIISNSNMSQFAVIAIDTCYHCTIKNTTVNVRGKENHAINIVNGNDNNLKDIDINYKYPGLSHGIIIENSKNNRIENLQFTFPMKNNSFSHIHFQNLPKQSNNKIAKSDTNQELIFSKDESCSVKWPSNAASLESNRKDGSDCPFYDISINYSELVLK